MTAERTVAAPLSPPGMGGLAIIEIVGPRAHTIVDAFIRPNPASNIPTDAPALRRWFEDGEHIDDVLVVTGTARVTVCCHGGIRIVERILLGLQRRGAEVHASLETKTVWPGLAPVERDVMARLPEARTPRVAQWLSSQISAVPQAIRRVLSAPDTEAGRTQLQHLVSSYPRARRLLSGVRVALAGPPNAGKSTLANRLFDQPWSLASPEPGTTRDWVTQPIALAGIPIEIIDTAGLRVADDSLEARAIGRGVEMIDRADLVLMVIDVSAALPQDAWALMTRLAASGGIAVLNKHDLVPGDVDPVLVARATEIVGPPVLTSALHGTGLDTLRKRLVDQIMPDGLWPCPAIWEPHHHTAVSTALENPPGAAQDVLRDVFLGPAAQTSVRWGPIVYQENNVGNAP